MYQHLIPDYPVMEVVSKYGLGYVILPTYIQPIGYATAHFLIYMFSQAQSFVKKRGLRVNSWKFQVFRLAGANAFSNPSG